jgi:hypothetical protein
MADPRDDRVSSAYRGLPGEGPPPAIDAAIQAAARRAVGSRPAAARRFQVPLSIAAVLALAIAVSLQVEREKPVVVDGTPVSSGSAEYPVSQPEPEKEEPAAPVQAPVTREAPRKAQTEAAAPREVKRFAPDPPRADTSSSAPASPPAPASMPAPPAPMPAAPPSAAGATVSADAVRAAPQAAKRAKSELAREATVQEKKMSEALDTPERRLERIADLRAKGLHVEADRALGEFRRAFPDYRISEEWLRRVERR